MSIEVKNWIDKGGIEFLRKIGIERNDVVLDFGCGEGHYTIPLAKVVGESGKVYALDKDRYALGKLRETAERESLNNIEIIPAETRIPLKDNSVNVVLCYDVIHYEKNRERIYKEVYRVLHKDGLFSVYPKHYKDDYPLMELASLSLEDIIEEIEVVGFTLKKRMFLNCLHDDYMKECQILNFRK